MIKRTKLGLALVCTTLTACGGAGGSGSHSKPVTLTGWYNCGGIAHFTDSLGNPTIALFTASGNMYGSCGGNSTFTAQYTAQLPDISLDASYITANLTNFWFYDTLNNQRAVNGAHTPIPVDSFTGTGSYGPSLVDINFVESGAASKAGAIDDFVIPTAFTFAQFGGSSPPVRPTAIAGFTGHYGQMMKVPVAVSGNITTYTWTPQVDFDINGAGNISAALPSGSLSAATNKYDPATGVGEFSGTFTSSSGANAAVSGAYAYSPIANVAGGYPVTIYIVGPSFEYTYNLSLKT